MTKSVQAEFSAAKRGRLREARTSRGMKLERLAKQSGYGVSTISSVENGHHNPSARYVRRIAEILGVRAEWIETGKGKMIDEHRPPSRLWLPFPDNYVDQLKEIAEGLHDRAVEMEGESAELSKQARTFEEIMKMQNPRAAARAEEANGRVEKELTESETHDSIGGNVKAQLPSLLEQLRKATAEPGQKTALAKFLGAPLASVSRWLSGEREPGGETVLQMQAWLKRPK